VILAAASEWSEGTWWLIGAVGLGLYVVLCLLQPFTTCALCGGDGKWLKTGGKRKKWRTCPRCCGKGNHVRLGRRLFTMGRKGR
jgi:hypothetical protein